MKNLFKKYYNSVLGLNEFSEAAGFFSDKKNEPTIFRLMQYSWNMEMNASVVSKKTNPVLFERIKEVISFEKQETAHRKIKIYTWSLRVAAIFVIALLLSNIFFLHRLEQNQMDNNLQTINIPPGAKTNITLPDGSNVWLNSGSTITYPLRFDEKRPLTLVGEAYFEVVKSDKPFVVTTAYGDVEVKGTSFNVKAYNDDNDFATTLEEGLVTFRVKDTEKGVTLRPGEQIVKTDDGYTLKRVETRYYTSWKDGQLLFNREPFPDFIKRLERWYNVRIEYADHELDGLWYTGTIEMESISEVMEMISKAAPVTYSFNNKTRVFTIETK